MRNRVIALIITFAAGAIGIHKFYLGKNFAGIMYFLFCWTFIPALLSFFDFLGLAFMSDETFDRQFNGVAVNSKNLGVSQAFMEKNRHESSKEIAATLGELKKLYDNGIITAEEYESKRRKLLDSI
jgi:TM2 domain-containing membrane protein YozV